MNVKCAILTCRDKPQLIPEEHLFLEQLSQKNIVFEIVIWNSNIDWKQFKWVIIRCTWDYYLEHSQFAAVLKKIVNDGCQLFNSLDTVLWNMDKTYLKDLEKQDIPIVPTTIISNIQSCSSLLKKYPKMILKPTISAGSYHTYVVTEENIEQIPDISIPFLIQPFCESIITEGEWSFMFFGRTFSHAVLKNAALGDFRVQEEYGGTTKLVVPNDQDLKQVQNIIASIPPQLFARVDMTRFEGRLHLMELELVEPQLFLDLHPNAPKLLVDNFLQQAF